MSRRGLFITFEGPEGSGKSSQAKTLAAALRRHGRRVVLVRDPGSTALGRGLRRVLLHTRQSLSPMAEALLFFAARVQLVEEQIRPALRRGAVVVCDRFHDSTVAYQGYGGRMDAAWLDRVGRRTIGEIMPDVTVMLDAPVEVGFARLKHAKDRMEGKALSFHRRLRRGYLCLAKQYPKRCLVIDATQSPVQVHKQILTLVLTYLPRR